MTDTNSRVEHPVVQSADGTPIAVGEIDVDRLVSDYRILGVENGVVIATYDPILDEVQRLKAPAESTGSVDPDFSVYGWAGMKSFFGPLARGEYNVDLQGERGRRVYDQMRRQDASVRTSMRIVKMPVLAARWFVDPFSDKKRDKTIAEFVWKNFTDLMAESWTQHLYEALLMLDFGFYPFEKVWDIKTIKGKDMVYLKMLAPRHPMDIMTFHYDNDGIPTALEMYGPDGPSRFIPWYKLICYTFDKEGGDLEGISLLRSAYKHWYYKENLYKVDAIQKERHGIGIPVIQLPPNFSKSDRLLADQIGRNLRVNEKAHLVLPPNWVVSMLKLEGKPVDALASAEHHDLMIVKNVLASFLNNASGLVDESTASFFLKVCRWVAGIIADVFNKWVIPELVGYNWPTVEDYPVLKVRRIGDTVDWRTISFAVRNLVGAQIIQPDDDLETFFREEMDMPQKDPSSIRQPPAPQNPGSGGGPRQSTAGGMQQQAQGTGKSNAGTDNSGSAKGN